MRPKIFIALLLMALLWTALPTKIALAATPVINTIADDRTTQGTTYTKAPTLSAGGTVTWSKAYGPDDLTVNSTTGAVSWAIPASLPSESFHIGVKATNADGSDTEVWVLTVGNGTVRYVGTGQTYTSISAATAAAASGDTIIIKDGTYTGSSNTMVNGGTSRGTMPPNGSAGTYTTVIAETPGSVTIDGQGARNVLWGIGAYVGRDPCSSNNCGTYDTSYLAFKGLIFTGNSSEGPIFINRMHHMKFIDCGAFDTSGATDGGSPIMVYRSGNVLVEGCYTWGRGRMQITFYICDNVIMRRCVAREEATNGLNPVGVFDFYACQHARGQDLIAIDGTFNAPNYTNSMGSLINNKGGYSSDLLDTKFYNTITLNQEGLLLATQNTTGDPAEIYNSIAWDIKLKRNSPSDTAAMGLMTGSDEWIADQCTFGRVTSPDVAVNGNCAFNGWSSNQSITNSIIDNFRNNNGSPLGMFRQIETADYLNIYDVGAIDVYDGRTVPTHTISTDPQTHGLLYLPRIETGSSLKTGGAGGKRVGAEILHFRGKSGTLFGETGYDDETNVSSWPWPHEDIIKTKMSAYPSTGTRGFCAAGNGLYGGPVTLTSYIWEYLGNACPSDACPVVAAASLQGDLNGDNTVNIFDYNIFLANFGNSQCGNIADIDRNCTVNIFDYNALLSHFGQVS